MKLRTTKYNSIAVKDHKLPRFLHLLTTIHGLGAIACFTMAIGSALSDSFRESLVLSEGSRLVIEVFGRYTWVFLLMVGTTLTILAYSSWRMLFWAWHMTIILYGIGVAGSLWEVSIGIWQGWISATINACVVLYCARTSVRNAYRIGRQRHIAH
jgi:hypothetical protein